MSNKINKRPNVVIIMADQVRADLCAREGFDLNTMPFVDQLADDGVDFSRAYTPTPVCGPARSSMLTGRYPSALHVKTNHNLEDAFYSKDLLDVLKEEGYSTALCGKNHSHVNKEDFDYCYTLNHDGGLEYKSENSEEETKFDEFLSELKHLTYTEPTPFSLECQGPYRAVSRAQNWINQQKDNPFFMWLSFAEPHNPYQVPEPYFSMFAPESLPSLDTDKDSIKDDYFPYKWTREKWEEVIDDFEEIIPRTRSNYLGMLRLIDDQIKRFVTFLKEKEKLDNTIIFFLTDHGDFVGEYGLIRKGPGLSEPLIRIPMLAYGYNIQKQSIRNDDFVSIVDILPTICEAIDIKIPNGVQGKSLWPLLKGEDYPKEEFSSIYCEHGYGGQFYNVDDTLDPRVEGAINDSCTFDELNSWTQSGTTRMVRKGDWKLIYNMEGNGQLYNLEKDPRELDNLFDNEKYANVRSDLIEELLTWMLRVQDDLPYPRNRYRVKKNNHNYWVEY